MAKEIWAEGRTGGQEDSGLQGGEDAGARRSGRYVEGMMKGNQRGEATDRHLKPG